MGLLFLILAGSLIWPWLHGESPFELGLDLAGGVRVTYRAELDEVRGTAAELPRAELLALAKETLAGRLRRQFDTLPDIVVRGDGRLVVSLPGEHDQRRVLDLIGKTYRMSFHPVAAIHDDVPADAEGRLVMHEGRRLELGEEVLSGDMLDPGSIRVETGQGSLEQLGRGASISFRFSPPYDEAFAQLTAAMKGETLAILLDDSVEWAGIVEGEIRGAGVLQGGYTVEEAAEVASMLRSGQMPVPLEVESLSGVGPGLGHAVFTDGARALMWSLGLSALLMLVAYGRRPALWMTAWISLATILFLIAGAVALLDLTVDMVAVAGLVLSVGMGLDAFILIFEAFRARSFGGAGEPTGPSEKSEEGRRPTSPLGEVRRLYGFGGEGRTLVHANASTFLVVLLLFFSDRLHGFATFLSVGLAASLATILVTRSLLEHAARRGRLEPKDGENGWALGLGPLRSRLSRPRIFRFRNVYFALLLTFLALSTASFHQRGFWLPLGPELRPGMQIGLALPADDDPQVLVEALQDELDGVSARIRGWHPSGVELDGDRAYLLSLSGATWEEGSWTIAAADSATASSSFGPAQVLESHGAEVLEMHSVDSQLSARRVLGSLTVLIGSVLLLGFYLKFVQPRLDAWGASSQHRPSQVMPAPNLARRILLGTVGAVILDVGVALGVLGWTGRPLDMAVIAAVLTVVGYSVNDSMVLWSRLSRPELGPLTPAVVEREVDGVLSRALLTSLSTMIPVAAILGVGPEPLAGFAWTVLAGTAAGTLSSLFVVSRAALGKVD